MKKGRQLSLTPSSSIPLRIDEQIFNIKDYFCQEDFQTQNPI
jgi:hypothetical protein